MLWEGDYNATMGCAGFRCRFLVSVFDLGRAQSGTELPFSQVQRELMRLEKLGEPTKLLIKALQWFQNPPSLFYFAATKPRILHP